MTTTRTAHETALLEQEVATARAFAAKMIWEVTRLRETGARQAILDQADDVARWATARLKYLLGDLPAYPDDESRGLTIRTL